MKLINQQIGPVEIVESRYHCGYEIHEGKKKFLVDKRLRKGLTLYEILDYCLNIKRAVANYRLQLLALHIPLIGFFLWVAFQPNQGRPLYFLSTFLIGIFIWTLYELNMKAEEKITKKYYPSIHTGKKAVVHLLLQDFIAGNHE